MDVKTKCTLLIVILSILCGCTINGTITDEAGAPLTGVTVRLSGPLDLETTTDENGRYAFSHQQIVRGTFTVTPSSELCEFMPQSKEVRVTNHNVNGVDFICPNAPFTIMKSDLERDTQPDITPEDVQTLVAGNTEFALNIYQQLLARQSGNLFYSPYSISTALAMLYGGARGDTETQMADCLQFSLPQETIHRGFNYLDLELSSRADIQPHSMTDPEILAEAFSFNIGNAIWLQHDYPVLPAYLDNLALNYGTGMYLLDFFTQPEPSRLIINDWVAEQTMGRIEDLIPEESIDKDTRVVLTNTIYFKARWNSIFDADDTKDEPFYPLNQSAVTTAMMHQEDYFEYAAGENYQALELPYLSDQTAMAMMIIVPDAGAFEAFEASLNGDRIAEIKAQLQSTYIDLAMPKWQYRSKFELKEVLSALGMTDVFNWTLADLSGINGYRELFAKDIIHQAFVSVNEKGTEATAATVIVVPPSGDPPTPQVMTIDRPFIFLIHDRLTQTVTFLGRVVDPT